MSRRVLIVDDSEPFRRVFVRMLRKIAPKASFDEAGDGIEALGAFRRGQYDLVFLDVDMPRMNGWTALEKIQELEGKAKVYMVSASCRESGTAKAFRLGASGFFAKPIDVTEFVKLFSDRGPQGASLFQPGSRESLTSDT